MGDAAKATTAGDALSFEAALERLEEGTYDKCAQCGGEIPIERLKAKPAVTLCVQCQSAKESSED